MNSPATSPLPDDATPGRPGQTVSRRGFLGLTALAGAGISLNPEAEAAGPTAAAARLFGFRVAPMERVRIGFVGVGNRGSSLLADLLTLEGVEIKAVCDTDPARVEAARQAVRKRGRPEPAAYGPGATAYTALCRRDDVDLVYIATPWDSHTPIAVEAMRQGRHVAIEVPAALTLAECWQLVDTAERTRRHCVMLENCCYGETELLVLRLARAGVLGELTHAEAGYLHDVRDYLLQDLPGAAWRREFVARWDGNLYPTHGLGPVSQYLGIHAGDRFERLVSMSSLERGLSRKREALPAGKWRPKERFVCGDINTSLLRTARGRTVMVQYSLAGARPYSRINLLAGTSGTFCDYPPRLHLDGQPEGWVTDLRPYHESHGHPLWRRITEAERAAGHGGMDHVMNARLIQCLREGWPLDLTVYDAAVWSSLVPLSIASVKRGNAPVTVPDFTRGAWREAPPSALATMA